MRTTRDLAFVLLLVGTAGCGSEPEPPPQTPAEAPVVVVEERAGLSEEFLAVLDSGSEAFRADDYQASLAHYTRATELDPEVAAGWFGVYMAHQALGNAEAAAEALERARALDAGADMIHPAERPR